MGRATNHVDLSADGRMWNASAVKIRHITCVRGGKRRTFCVKSDVQKVYISLEIRIIELRKPCLWLYKVCTVSRDYKHVTPTGLC